MSGAHVERSPLERKVGERMRRLRERRGLGLKQVAPLIGIDQGALSRMERGERPINRETVRDLARILGVPATYLEFGTPELVYVLVAEDRFEAIAGFSRVVEADEWAAIADASDPATGYRVVAIAVDDTETMRLFAEERLASSIQKEVAA